MKTGRSSQKNSPGTEFARYPPVFFSRRGKNPRFLRFVLEYSKHLAGVAQNGGYKSGAGRSRRSFSCPFRNMCSRSPLYRERMFRSRWERVVSGGNYFFLGTGTSHGVPVLACGCSVCKSENPKNKRTRSSLWVQTQGGRAFLLTPRLNFACRRSKPALQVWTAFYTPTAMRIMFWF